MADFRQLALEFVLADDEGQQTRIAQKAAKGKSPETSYLGRKAVSDLYRNRNCSCKYKSCRSMG